MKNGGKESYYVELIKAKRRKWLEIFRGLKDNIKANVFRKLPKKTKKEILESIPTNEALKFIHFFDYDEIADYLQLIGEEKRQKILKGLEKEIKEKVKFLLRFDPNTAGGLMDLNYIIVDVEETIGEVLKKVKNHTKRVGKFPVILAIERGKLKGELPPYLLGFLRKNQKVKNNIRRVPHVYYYEEEEKIIKKFRSHPHNKVVVLDEDGSVLGVIFSEDILKLIDKDTLSEFAGIKGEESLANYVEKVRFRYRWLIINLFTGFLAAFVVSLFEETIKKAVVLASYMPIIAGMGGNAATQTLAVVVRGLALNEISFDKVKDLLVNEVLAGIVNGVINGLIILVVALIFNQNPIIGAIAFVAMVSNLVVAAFFGTIIPLILKKLGKDPASSASIFITTATDVFGFLTFLGLAKVFLG